MGITLFDTTLYTLSFADDQLVIVQEYEDPNIMTKTLIREYIKWRTEYLCVGGKKNSCDEKFREITF